jgi:hypothetical protein
VELSHGLPLAVRVCVGMMRAPEPARSGKRGLKTSCRSEHVRGVAAPHHSQVPENVGEAALARTGSLRPGESSMRNFANEGHSAVAEAAQGFEGDGAESVTWTIVALEVLLQLLLVPAPGRTTSLLGGAMHIAGSERVDEKTSPRT